MDKFEIIIGSVLVLIFISALLRLNYLLMPKKEKPFKLKITNRTYKELAKQAMANVEEFRSGERWVDLKAEQGQYDIYVEIFLSVESEEGIGTTFGFEHERVTHTSISCGVQRVAVTDIDGRLVDNDFDPARLERMVRQ